MTGIDELRSLAHPLGIETSYWDVRGVQRHASADAILAAMDALGVDADGTANLREAVEELSRRRWHGITDPVVVWGDGPLVAHAAVPPGSTSVEAVVRLEAGGERAVTLAAGDLPRAEDARLVELPGPWPVGYHELHLHAGAAELQADVIVAPARVASLAPTDRLWGVLAPVYSLAGGSGLGAHVGELAALADAIGTHGGGIVATLPVLASHLGEPFDPSPYAPVSRRFWNELFVDLAALPELTAVPGAMEGIDGRAAHAGDVPAHGGRFDYRSQHERVRDVLARVLAARDRWPAGLQDGFDAYLDEHPDVVDYARFRAFGESCRSGWRSWPPPQRAGRIAAGDVADETVTLHAFGQYAMDRDMAALGRRLTARSQRLYLDLPVGASAHGYDTWRERDVYAADASVGAPPDDFFAGGQVWGFPPLRPYADGNAHLWHLRAVLRHHMSVAHLLRLDHVMGFERLYWVSDGLDARDGVYVRYPCEQMMAVLCVESARSGCAVVGEDLGTVTDSVRSTMARHGLAGMYVVEFSQPASPGAPPAPVGHRQVAAIGTHDMPTLAGWLRGLDIDARLASGHTDDAGAEVARVQRRAQVSNLIGFLAHRGEVAPGTGAGDERAVLEGLLRYLGDSDAVAVVVSVEDLAGGTEPQNVPGTSVERPNWTVRVDVGAAALAADEAFTRLLQALQACRLGSHLRAVATAGRVSDDG